MPDAVIVLWRAVSAAPSRAGGALMLALLVGIGAAQAESVFTVRGIAIDAQANSATAARQAAIGAGQREALTALMRRLTVVDPALLPEPPSADLLTAMVNGFSLTDELVAPTRYRAELSVDFAPEAVRRFLRESGVAYAETESKPQLVIAVFGAGAGATVWDDGNPWRRAWLERPPRGGLVPLVMPLGDIIDLSTLDAAQALAPDRDALSALAERYNTDEIIVTVAEMPNLGAADAPAQGVGLSVSVRRVGPAHNDRRDYRLAGEAGETQRALFYRAINQVVEALEGEWKSANLVRFDQETELALAVPLSTLGDWVAVRERLARLPIVAGVELASLSRAEADVTLRYFGTPAQLNLALKQADLVLSFDVDRWTLRTEESLRAAVAPERDPDAGLGAEPLDAPDATPSPAP